jgi:hypothetical protein
MTVFSFSQTTFYFLIVKETLLCNEQNRLFHEDRWQENDITEKYYQTTCRLVCVSIKSIKLVVYRANHK